MVPSVTDPRWVRLIDHPRQHTYRMLALQILMQRVALKNNLGLNAVEKRALIVEVQSFFCRNERMAQDDLHTIFGGGKRT